jgi:hypothetical protein
VHACVHMLKDCKGEGRVHGEVRPHTMVMLLAAASGNAAKGATILFCSRKRRILRGKKRGGGGGALCAVRAREALTEG